MATDSDQPEAAGIPADVTPGGADLPLVKVRVADGNTVVHDQVEYGPDDPPFELEAALAQNLAAGGHVVFVEEGE